MKKTMNVRLRLDLNTVRRLTTSNLEQVHGGRTYYPKSEMCSVQLDCPTSHETNGCPVSPRCGRE